MKTILLMLAVVAEATLVFAAELTITVEGTLVSSACYLGPKHQTGNDMGMGVVRKEKSTAAAVPCKLILRPLIP